MESSQCPPLNAGWSRWFGKSAWVVVAIFVLGRLALEPFRGVPHFDDHGMDAYGATETYVLKKNPAPVEVACFGSSQSVFGILPLEVAVLLGENPERVRNLGTPGGTPFDMWNMVRRNEQKFKDLHLAVVEINPFVLSKGLENDNRLLLTLSQKASLHERMIITNRSMRHRQLVDYVMPFYSVRRSLRSAVLNLMDPVVGNPLCPNPDQRIYPAMGWAVNKARPSRVHERQTLAPETAARRFFANWRLSPLQDQSLRNLLAWFSSHKVPVVLHQMPVHPDVAMAVQSDPRCRQGYADFSRYVESLTPAPAAFIRLMSSEDCGVSREDLADRTHLNETGAGIYSRYLAHKILEVPGLPVPFATGHPAGEEHPPAGG